MSDEIQALKISGGKIEYNGNVCSVTETIGADIAGKHETAVCEAIIDAARRAGYDEYYIVDPDFLKEAIVHEHERREIMSHAGSICPARLIDADALTYERAHLSCGARMDGEEGGTHET